MNSLLGIWFGCFICGHGLLPLLLQVLFILPPLCLPANSPIVFLCSLGTRSWHFGNPLVYLCPSNSLYLRHLNFCSYNVCSWTLSQFASKYLTSHLPTLSILDLLVHLGLHTARCRSRSKVSKHGRTYQNWVCTKNGGRKGGWRANLYPDLTDKAEINNQYYFQHGMSNPAITPSVQSSAHQGKNLTSGLIFTWFTPETWRPSPSNLSTGEWWMLDIIDVPRLVKLSPVSFILWPDQRSCFSPHEHQSLQTTEYCFPKHFCGSWLLGRGRPTERGKPGEGRWLLWVTFHSILPLSAPLRFQVSLAEDASLRGSWIAATWVLQCELPCAFDVDLWQQPQPVLYPWVQHDNGNCWEWLQHELSLQSKIQEGSNCQTYAIRAGGARKA